MIFVLYSTSPGFLIIKFCVCYNNYTIIVENAIKYKVERYKIYMSENTNLKIFDSHAHYDDDAFDEDREQLLIDVHNSGIERIVNIGCDVATSEATLKLTENYDYIYGAVGIIPHHVGDIGDKDIDRIRELANSSPKIVAIGEIGLDYYYDEPSRELQHKWFRAQLDLARELGLPVVIHSREAAMDTIQIMKDCHAEEIGGVVHCYSYSMETSDDFLKMGFYFGIGGVVTFKNSKKLVRAVEHIPLDRIILETDCPYLAPTPNRGKRNDSRNLRYVAEKIAELKGITAEEVAEITYANACRMYNID